MLSVAKHLIVSLGSDYGEDAILTILYRVRSIQEIFAVSPVLQADFLPPFVEQLHIA